MAKLFVVIRSREKTLYMGEADSATSKNPKGTFDILPEHANFISLISDFIIVRPVGAKELVFTIERDSVLKVRDNRVSVYLGVSSNPQKIILPT